MHQIKLLSLRFSLLKNHIIKISQPVIGVSSSDTIYSVCFWKNSIDLVGLIFASYAVRAICAEYADSAGCVAMVFHWRYYLSVQLFTGVIGGLT